METAALPWLMRTGIPSAKQFTKQLKRMSRAAGSKKPRESQKAQALWAMKTAKNREEEFYDPAHKFYIVGRKQTRLELCEEHLKDQIIALDKALKCLQKFLSGLTSRSTFLRKVTQTAMACGWMGSGVLQKMWASGLTWTRGTAHACARHPLIRTFQGSMGRMASSSSSS